MGPNADVLVVGADGVVGGAVSACLAARGTPVLGTSRRGTAGFVPLDLAGAPSTWQLPRRVGVAVLCASVTSTAECREHESRARLVNVDATVELAARLAAAGATVVFPSSNQVFDGSIPFTPADATRCPRTAYGRMKAEAEAAILGLGAPALVVRMTKIVHRDLPVFARWRESLERGQCVNPFNDLPLAPVAPGFAATAIVSAIARGMRGVLQVSSKADLTYADVALRFVCGAGWRQGSVRPVSVAESGEMIEHLPLHTTLDTTSLREHLGLTPPEPWVAVDSAVAD